MLSSCNKYNLKVLRQATAQGARADDFVNSATPSALYDMDSKQWL